MVVEQLGDELKFGFDVGCPGGVACAGGTALVGGDGAEREPTDESVISHVESGRTCIRTAVTNFGGHYINGDGQMEARGLVIQVGTYFVLPGSDLAAVVFATRLGAFCGRSLLHCGPQAVQIIEWRVDDDLPHPVVRAGIKAGAAVTAAGDQ